MGKQAMGMYVTNYDSRMDKTAYVLSYPARPLVDTRLMGMVKLDKIPAGSPVIVAIMTHTGFNQEDSLLSKLGQREHQIFEMLSEGKKTSQIAEELTLKPNTVSTIKKVIYRKLGVNTSLDFFKFVLDNKVKA